MGVGVEVVGVKLFEPPLAAKIYVSKRVFGNRLFSLLSRKDLREVIALLGLFIPYLRTKCQKA